MSDKGEGVVQGNAARVWSLGFSFGPSVPREQRFVCKVLTINQVGCVLWSIYKMSKLLERKVLIYLRVVAKSWGVWDARVKESRVCTGVVSTGSEGNKQHEIITIRGNRVGV